MTPKITITAILAVAGSLAAMVAANAASTYQVMKPNQAIIQAKPQLKLAPLHVTCAAIGSPEFVHYGLLTNDGPRTIPAGSKVHWVMGKHSGNYTFTAALVHNKAAEFNLHFTTAATAPCSATFVQ